MDYFECKPIIKSATSFEVSTNNINLSTYVFTLSQIIQTTNPSFCALTTDITFENQTSVS